MLVIARPASAGRSLSEPLHPQDPVDRAIFGFEVGPAFSIPFGIADANRDELGADIGVTGTMLTLPHFGVGADLAYHYWPVSTAFKQAFNEAFRRGTWNTLELGGGTWGLQVLQIGGHLKFDTPRVRNLRPWCALGVHAYRVDPNTSGYVGDAGLFYVVSAPPLKATVHPGFTVSAGADMIGGAHARMGFGLTWYHVLTNERYASDLRVLTVGAHMAFGR